MRFPTKRISDFHAPDRWWISPRIIQSCYLNILVHFKKLEIWQEPCRPWFRCFFISFYLKCGPKQIFTDLSIFQNSFHPKWNVAEFLQARYLLGVGTIKYDFQLSGRRTQVRRPIFMQFYSVKGFEVRCRLPALPKYFLLFLWSRFSSSKYLV